MRNLKNALHDLARVSISVRSGLSFGSGFRVKVRVTVRVRVRLRSEICKLLPG